MIVPFLVLLWATAVSAFLPVPATFGLIRQSPRLFSIASPTVVDNIRNIAVIAHVDHGKTTLVDALIRQSGVFRDQSHAEEAGERVMDNQDQERERGITILSKNLAVRRGDVKINIMDTPGHADFGGEVERVLNMCDGVLLLVDSVEGPKPQTRFVLDKALKRGLHALVVVNKVDREAARVDEVVNSIFDLFDELGATDEQMDFRVVYASGLLGKAGNEPDELADDMGPLFDAITETILPPSVERMEPDSLQALVSNIDYDSFKGKMGIARILNGSVKVGQAVSLAHPNKPKKAGRVSSLYVFDNLGKQEVQEASAGEIIMFGGLENVEIGDTLVTDEENGVNAAEPLEPIAVEQPTMKMTIGVNKSPLAGRDGKLLTSRVIRDRLFKELDRNVALHVRDTDSADRFEVSGRGQLHLTVLVETLRREGFELEVGPPNVIRKTNEETGQVEEPWEMVEIRVPEEYVGTVVETLNLRKGEMQDMGIDDSVGLTLIRFLIPTRGTLGLRSSLLSQTRGTVLLDSVFHSYRPEIKGKIQARDKGSLLAYADGVITSFGVEGAQNRGQLFVNVGDNVYKNMIVGIHQRPGDLPVNVCKTKQLTNMRAATKDVKTGLSATVEMSLDACVEYLAADELLEVTPKTFRMCKNPEMMGKKGRVPPP
eukprot:Nitzschia sp. Nitz4//scaffold194_size40385//14683//16873//NITZ4_007527-RA/size40385-processed-gene-0.41-mRNA-1//-1//CDS//3329540325//7530//frame0